MTNFKLNLSAALSNLSGQPQEFAKLFQHGTLEVEIYKPKDIDKQTPHDRGEIYIIASGTSNFHLADQETTVATGDFLFVPAHQDHRFTSFSKDFSTWVFFYGPLGGEKSQMINHLSI